LKNYGRIIGIDVGTKRVGLARSDLLQTSANPAGTFSPEQVFSELEKYQKDYPIHAFVVGWPLSASGEITKSTGMAKAFIKKLNKHSLKSLISIFRIFLYIKWMKDTALNRRFRI